MKKIALDLDGVVFDSENLYRVYTEIYDIDTFKKDTLINNSKRIFQQRYNWGQEHFNNFYQKYAPEVLQTANIITGAEIVLKRLKNDFEFIIVTSRSDEEFSLAKESLSNLGLGDIKIFNNESQKITRLVSEKIDYLIDDDESICRKAANLGIHALYFKNAASDRIEENDFLKIVNNWGEIYKYLKLNGGIK